jgi:diguanylate cyclase (GGDEF)-like protein
MEARLADMAALDLPTAPAAAARAAVLSTWPRYEADSAAMLALADSGRRAEAAEAFRATGEAFDALGVALHVLLAAGEEAHAEAQRRIQQAADQTRWLTLTVGTGLLIIGLAMVLLFEASLVATAQRLLAAMRQVAAGDIHAPVPHIDRDDEFGDLARAVPAFANGLDGQRRRELALQAQAGTDELTGIANRRAFLERADDEINRSLRYGHTLSLLMLDIDHFKQVNDTSGHAAGDAALVRMVEACLPSLREHDFLARLGGEEFVVLLPHTDSARALLVAERLRDAVERAGVDTPAGLFHITVSIGSATLPVGEQPDAAAESLSMLLERADKALYRAKHGGRNRVVCSVLPAA